MDSVIKYYPVILLIIIIINIIIAERSKAASILRSAFNSIYIRKTGKLAYEKFDVIDNEDTHASRFDLFASVYLLVFSIFALHYFGVTPLHNRFSINNYREKPGFHALYQIKKDIPDNASVSVPSDIGVLLCEREKVYLFPTVKDAEYIVFDLHHRNADDYWDLKQVIKVLEKKQFGLYKKRGRFVILKKGLPLDGVNELIDLIIKRT